MASENKMDNQDEFAKTVVRRKGWTGSRIIGSVRKAWRGEERLWKVFWLWFVLLYPMSFVIGFSSFYFILSINFLIA